MKAAENGSARAQFALGFFYLYGIGLEKNEDQAIFWLKKSATQGTTEATALLEKLSKNISSDRYLCTADEVSYFSNNQDQKNCRVDRLSDGWENLFFQKSRYLIITKLIFHELEMKLKYGRVCFSVLQKLTRFSNIMERIIKLSSTN